MTNRSSTTSDQILAEEVALVAVDEVVDIIAESIPGINIPYKLTKAYLGRGLKLRQHRALEWVEFIRDNLGVFSQQLFENEQFQDCFVLLVEGYIKQRAQYKRKIFQQILLNIANISSEELEKFEVERMILVTNQISIDSLQVLAFIKNELVEKIEDDVQEQLRVFQDRDGVEGIRLEDLTRSRIIVSEYISKWLYKNYNINSEAVQEKYGFTSPNDFPAELRKEVSYAEHLKSKELMNPLPELATLGILLRKNGTATFGGSVGSGYSLTEFGYKYLIYLHT